MGKQMFCYLEVDLSHKSTNTQVPNNQNTQRFINVNEKNKIQKKDSIYNINFAKTFMKLEPKNI